MEYSGSPVWDESKVILSLYNGDIITFVIVKKLVLFSQVTIGARVPSVGKALCTSFAAMGTVLTIS